MTLPAKKLDLLDTKSVPKINSAAPIGLFDSGVGGLSVYQHLQKLLPNEHYLYFADTKNVPYGGRQSDDIIQLTLNAVAWLFKKGCKLIIIACNSASAHGLQIARQQFPNTPIVGLVPALKPAILATYTNHVAVLATQATLSGELLNDVIIEFAVPNRTKVTKHFNPNLVPWVEQGMPKTHQTANDLMQILHALHQNEVDQLVLGCTHYPFFRQFIEETITTQNLNIEVLDSGRAIALRVEQLLKKNGLLNFSPFKTIQTGNTSYPLHFYASYYDKQLEQVLNHIFPYPIKVLNKHKI